MIDWKDIAEISDEDKLKSMKLWLFQENIRIENEKKELAVSQEKFINERVRLKRELDELNRRTLLERKRLKEENLFFDKKMAILQDGFRQLEDDRKAFERQKNSFLQSMNELQNQSEPLSDNLVNRLFSGITNPLALRKRYRDLIKIYHPDNMFGDEALVQMINKEYMRRKEEL